MIKLSKVGTYDIKSVMQDSNGLTSELTWTVEVKESPADLKSDVHFYKTDLESGGKRILIDAHAAGGSGSYTYFYKYKLSDRNSRNTLSDGYVTDTEKTLVLKNPGEYTIRVEIRDSQRNETSTSTSVTTA